MASVLPNFPRFVFTVFEPLSLVAGFLAPVVDSEYFVREQIPGSIRQILTPNGHLVSLQLGNIYLLLAMIGIAVLYTTTDLRLVRNYMIALWLADIGHLAVTYHVLGHAKYFDIGNWNAMAYGNIGVTAFLCLTRSAYLLGIFGYVQESASVKTVKKAK